MMSEKIRIAYERTPLVLRPLAIGLPLLFVGHFFWTLGQDDAGVREAPPYVRKTEKPSPIPEDRARRLIEEHPEFQKIKQGVCPRRLPDDYDTSRQYPLISAMQHAGYLSAWNDTSTGNYMRVYDVTSAGRQALAGDLEEQGERFVVNIARRKLATRMEATQSNEFLYLTFDWRWEPLNAVGRELSLNPRSPHSPTYTASAKVARRGPLLEVVAISLSDEPDFMKPVY